MADSTRPSPLADDDMARLQRHLDERAAAARLAPTSLSAIVQRAERRSQRRRSFGVRAGALAMAAAMIGAFVWLNRDQPGGRVVPAASVSTTAESSVPETRTTVAVSTVVPTTIAPSRTVPASTDWSAHDAGTDSPVGSLYHSVAGDGPLFAWSTDERAAPDFLSTLYRSDDGLDWQPTATSPDMAILAATASSHRVVVLGYLTARDPHAATAVVVKVSDNDGSTWRTIPLPLEIPARDLSSDTLVRPTPASIAEAGDTIVASIGVSVDTIHLTPYSDQGNGALPAEIATQLYVSSGEQPFEPVSDGPVDASANSDAIVVNESDGGFLALAPITTDEGTQRSDLWRSDDGHAWTSLGIAPAQDPAGGIVGKVSGQYVVATPEGVWFSPNGQPWQTSDFAGLLTSNGQEGNVLAYAAAVDPTGITLVGMLPIVSADVDVTKDGVTGRLHGGSLSDTTFFDQATGAELGHVTTAPFDNGVVRALGDGKIDVLDSSGNVRTTFTLEDMTQALIAASATQPAPQEVILHSSDGLSWSSTSINAATGGRPGDVVWIAPVGDATTIGMHVDVSKDPTQPLSHLYVLAGTNR